MDPIKIYINEALLELSKVVHNFFFRKLYSSRKLKHIASTKL